MLSIIEAYRRAYSLLCKLTFIVLCGVLFLNMNIHVNAKNNSVDINVNKYEFPDKSNYEISEDALVEASSVMGKLSVSGNFQELDDLNGVPVFDVSSGNLEIKYTVDQSIFAAKEEDWHLEDDGDKKVDSINLDSKIKSGAMIVQTSLDGETWTTVTAKSDVFTKDNKWEDVIYSTEDIQLLNGCYYKIIFAYELIKKVGEKKILLVTADDTEEKKVAEVYKFYAINSTNANSTNASDTLRTYLGEKVKIKEGEGYKLSEKIDIDKNDPHFSWNIGTFFVNGYTSALHVNDKNNDPVFLKDVSDKVTLGFKLSQDITCLNGNKNLSIADDKNGSDSDAEVPEINFKHGTLIIKYTDNESEEPESREYTDYLKADVLKNVETKVQLCEEGDYEVILDYKIKQEKPIVGKVGIPAEYHDYKIAFNFKVRNGNCMVYAFDTQTQNELSDYSITQNGFKLDMKKSRYLQISVERKTIEADENGLLIENTIFNGPAKAGIEYTDEGIYVITVKNEDANEKTVKTIYVGNDRHLLALSKNRITVDELNKKLSDGYKIDDDGTLVHVKQ